MKFESVLLIIFTVGLILSLVASAVGQARIARDTWNGGICAECGSDYLYFDEYSRSRRIIVYRYICENCDNIIEIKNWKPIAKNMTAEVAE